MNYSPSDSVHGISQARMLRWVAISFFRGSSQHRDQTHLSCLGGRFFSTEPPGEPILACAAAAAKWIQSCPTLCDPIDSSPPGSPVAGILQARILEWGAIAFGEHLRVGLIATETINENGD